MRFALLFIFLSSPALAHNAQEQAIPLDYGALLSAIIGGGIVAFTSLARLFFEKRINNRNIQEQQNLILREDIRHRLDNFFGPLKELRTESAILYKVFANKEKLSQKHFRTLIHLTKGEKFSPQDHVLLLQIIEINQKIITLIEKQGWAVENTNLTEILGKFATHARLLTLASEGRLNKMDATLSLLVYPKEIDGAIESEILKLQDKYKHLLTPEREQSIRFQLSPIEKDSVGYYDKNYIEYSKKTLSLDMSEIYGNFLKNLAMGARILDAGCGAGRDTQYFIKNGYKVVSFDASHRMVKTCRQYPFAYCIQESFETISWTEEFDAVWACASLVHTPLERLYESLYKLFKAVKSGGIIYTSFKEGNHTSFLSDGRSVHFYEQRTIEEIAIEKLYLEPVMFWKNTSIDQPSNDTWMNFIFRKPKM